ncbi:MAG TPA: 4Fe-4S binding protein [Propionibacteriaceae bacterium]|nr:4Fe-4S binding protein [Propionibacteriaceae bacterium]
MTATPPVPEPAPHPVPEPAPKPVPEPVEGPHAAIALSVPACTSCDICVVECPAWCIELESHAEPVPDLPPGARARTHRVLDSFTVDYGRCLFCGICVEECPFDALSWSPEPERPGAVRVDLVRQLAAGAPTPD